MRTTLRAASLIVLVLAALLVALAIDPAIDLSVARIFFEMEGGSFTARFDRPLIILRDFGYYLPIVVLAVLTAAWIAGLGRTNGGIRDTGRAMLFLAASLALGPGLFVNVVLKDASHRPRPVQVKEFGGDQDFRPWFAFDGSCKTNCSFASGEVAGAAWLVAPASLVPAPWQPVAFAAVGLFTMAVAALRMAFGGHFASDVIAAALLTIVTVVVLARLVLRPRAGFDPGSPEP